MNHFRNTVSRSGRLAGQYPSTASAGKTRQPRRLRLSLAVSAALGLGFGMQANAAGYDEPIYTWTGAADGNWSNGNNWTHKHCDTVPTVGCVNQQFIAGAPSSSGDMIFNSSPRTTINVPGGTIYSGGISFGSTAGAYTFNGGVIGLMQGINNNSNKLQTFNFRIDVYGDQTWDGGTGGLRLDSLATLDNALTLANKVSLLDPGSASVSSVGNIGTGSLNIANSSSMSSLTLFIGKEGGSNGTVTLSTASSALNVTSDLVVGYHGEGALGVYAGAKAISESGYLGYGSGTGFVTVSGAGSSWVMSKDLYATFGDLSAQSSGFVSGDNAYLARYAGTTATVTVGGRAAGSPLVDARFSATKLLSVGQGGNGSLTIQTGGTVTADNLAIGATGTVNLLGGTLQVATGSNAGTADSFNWLSGTLNFTGNALTGDGQLLGRSTTLAPGASLLVNQQLTVALDNELTLLGGSVRAHGLNNLGSMTVGSFSGVVAAAGGITNNGALTLAGGTVSATGLLLNNAFLSGYGVIAGSGGFSNLGLLTQAGGPLDLANTGSNINTGNWDLLDGRGMVLSGGNLLNFGVMSLSGGTVSGTATLINGTAGTLTGRGVINAQFQNAGRMTVDAGSFRIDRNFRNDGQILMGSTTATLAGGNITNAGRILGVGQINNEIINSGTVGAVGGTLTLDGKLTNNGIVSAGRDATVLMSRGLASNTGKIQLAGGGFDNNGFAMSNEVGAVISGFGSLAGGQLTNKGKLLLSGGSSTVYADILAVNASQIILSGLSNNTFYGKLDVQSGAELRVSTGSVATFFGDVYQRTGAKFTGAGTKRFEGSYTPGASPGMGSDEGDVEFGESSRYLAEIGGITACTLRCGDDDAFKNSSFDKYIVDGKLSLAGTLQLVSWNGFVAKAGQHFDLLDWGSLSGQFDTIDASGFKLAAGTKLDFSQLYTTGEISVLAGVTAVPEPATYALWLAGLVGMGYVGRRRRAVKA